MLPLSLLCLLVLLVIGWRLHFVHPVPLPACNFDGHRGGDRLLEAINCRESRDDEAQNDHGGDVEKQVLSLHQELVVSPDVKAVARPERKVILSDAVQLRSSLRWVLALDKFETALLHDQRL